MNDEAEADGTDDGASAEADCDSASLRADLRAQTNEELHRRLAVAQRCRMWDDFIYITRDLVRREERLPARARYHYTIGMISWRELNDADAAAAALTEALRLDPSMARAREQLDALPRTQ